MKPKNKQVDIQNSRQPEEQIIQVHSIETFGTHDGPGIRLVVFTQGCLFACAYCHNPDSRFLVSPSAKQYSVAQIIKQLEKQKPYFGKEGGLTISGGEPTVQADAILELIKQSQSAGFHTALDTCGAIFSKKVTKIYDYVDLVMLDVKHINPEWHKKLTGQDNKTVLQNAEYREKTGKPLWLRYVLVPGWTDQPEYLHEWGKTFANYKTLQKVEILPYHLLGVHKYKMLGIPYKLEGVPAATKKDTAAAQKIFSQYFDPAIIEVK